MTVRDILNDVDLKYPNDAEEAPKRQWLLTIEKQLLDECLLTHVLTDAEQERAEEMAEMTDAAADYEPLAQPPYQDLYLHYVAAQIALVNVDTEQYENEQQLYNSALLTYKNWFNRTHRTLIRDNRWRI